MGISRRVTLTLRRLNDVGAIATWGYFRNRENVRNLFDPLILRARTLCLLPQNEAM